jgi:hypothetical protein
MLHILRNAGIQSAFLLGEFSTAKAFGGHIEEVC